MSDKKTILVVDDEPDVLTYLGTFFKDNGYNILEATTGAEAYQQAKDNHPDLITLDITMPEQSGVKAYKQLREDDATKDIPVIIVTGYEDPNFKKFIHTRRTIVEPDGFFEKPIDRDEVLEKVRELLTA